MREHVSLRDQTTLKVGGAVRFFIEAKTEKDVKDAIAFARKENLPLLVIGGGSNTLISDAGFSGVAVKIATKGIFFEEQAARQEKKIAVRAAAGEDWDALVVLTISRGLSGFENLSGIPGTVGAAPIQNIGAYGAEAKDSIVSVRALDTCTLEEKIFSNAECRFEYRDSFFKTPEGKQFVILEVTFELSREAKPNISYKDLKEYFQGIPTISEIRKAVLEIRSKKFPDLSKVGTAGSFFKNPIITESHFEELKSKFPELPFFAAKNGVKIPLAYVLDKICDLKGFKKGNIELFQSQPLVLVNTGGATAQEIKDFASQIAKMVREKTGIEIENEVVFVG